MHLTPDNTYPYYPHNHSTIMTFMEALIRHCNRRGYDRDTQLKKTSFIS